ncbi:MAG: cytochrome P450 [Anaerolineae bacterium]|nr:cytochrome P450 [Anaerolineae bacterium]
MATMPDVISQIDQTLAAAEQSLKAENSVAIQAAIAQVSQLDAQARETLQARLNEHLWPVVAKLENGDSLAAAEQDMLQTLLVGDAKSYVKNEDRVDTWKSEIERLVEEIRRLQATDLNELSSLTRLQALCREVMRILPDLVFFYEEKERVHRFDEAMRGAIDRDTRRTLANLIKEMLASDKV